LLVLVLSRCDSQLEIVGRGEVLLLGDAGGIDRRELLGVVVFLEVDRPWGVLLWVELLYGRGGSIAVEGLLLGRAEVRGAVVIGSGCLLVGIGCVPSEQLVEEGSCVVH
jgi:hypothetical protein